MIDRAQRSATRRVVTGLRQSYPEIYERHLGDHFKLERTYVAGAGMGGGASVDTAPAIPEKLTAPQEAGISAAMAELSRQVIKQTQVLQETLDETRQQNNKPAPVGAGAQFTEPKP